MRKYWLSSFKTNLEEPEIATPRPFSPVPTELAVICPTDLSLNKESYSRKPRSGILVDIVSWQRSG